MQNRKYKINEDYFENIDSEDRAYFLGYLFADGCVRTVKANKNHGTSYAVVLKLHKKDIHILQLLNTMAGGNYPITKSKNTNCYTLAMYSKKLVEDLIKHGCVPNKTFLLKFPTTVPDHLINHFIRGYFDGDGCCFRNKIKNIHSFHLLGTQAFLYSIRETFNKKMMLGNDKFLVPYGNIYKLGYGSIQHIKIIFEYLYNGASIYLERKHKKFKECLDDFKENINIRNSKKQNIIDLRKQIINKNNIDPLQKGSVSKLTKLWNLAPTNSATVINFLKTHYGRQSNVRNHKMHVGQ